MRISLSFNRISFLTISCECTDFHPDRFYKPYSSSASEDACHRGTGPAGLFGAETTDCDTPITLINATFQCINDNLKHEIDFVICTGDSARHDSDDQIPRTEKEVLELNTMLVDKFTEIFEKKSSIPGTDSTNDMIIPIVPTFGNNDILPHNIMYPGPNYWTKHFLKVWRKLIPEEQRHGFERGGWFFVETIPHQLAVFSLNTIYFFDSNGAVDGCGKKSEPGFEQMEWLRIQLQFLRERGMKAIITGHVPPARTESKQSWDETCWQKYALWMQQYRDVVVGSVYGHMNIDHFMLQDFKDIKKKTRKGRNIHVEKYPRMALNDDTLTAQTKSEYLSDLRTDWSQIPDPPKSKRKSKNCEGFFCDLVDYVNDLKTQWAELPEPPRARSRSGSCIGAIHNMVGRIKHKSKKSKKSKEEKYLEKIGGPWGENYALSLVSPSVIPNYFPTMRVVEYNISGIDTNKILPAEDARDIRPGISEHEPTADDFLLDDSMISISDLAGGTSDDSEIDHENVKKNKKHHKKKPHFTVPLPPSSSTPPGPAYSPQTFSWLGYTQYFANLTQINNDFPDKDAEEDVVDAQRWKEGERAGKGPKVDKPKKHHAAFKFEIEYDTRNDTIWGLQDLSIRSYLDLARMIGHYKPPKENGVYTKDHEKQEQDALFDGKLDEKDDQLETIGRKKKNRGKHHKKKGKKHGKGRKEKINEAWFTFVRRAFVGAVDDEALKEEFGMA